MHETAFVGDHPALDLLNTVARIDGELVDAWHSDADVAQWLKAAGLLPATHKGRAGLLAAARALRETVRTAIAARKGGHLPDLRALNGALAHAQRHLALAVDDEGVLQLQPRYTAQTPEALLAPLAESAAELLVTGDFTLVKQCEDPQCVLWFLDRTKSHRRRWCSMALCGNRHKVASFRQRQQQG